MVDFIGLSRIGFANARWWYAWSTGTKIVLFGLAAMGLFLESAIATYLLTLFALVTELANWGLGRVGKDWELRAREAIRRGLLIDALGAPADDLDCIDLRKQFGDVTKAAATTNAASYYASKQPIGPARLRDHIQESAFWSKHLFEAAAKESMIRFVGLFLIIIVLAAIIIPISAGNAPLLTARIVLLCLAGMSISESMDDAISWRYGARVAEQTDQRVERLQDVDVASLLAIYMDYSVATAIPSAVPPGLYEKHKSQLDELWAKRAPGGQ